MIGSSGFSVTFMGTCFRFFVGLEHIQNSDPSRDNSMRGFLEKKVLPADEQNLLSQSNISLGFSQIRYFLCLWRKIFSTWNYFYFTLRNLTI